MATSRINEARVPEHRGNTRNRRHAQVCEPGMKQRHWDEIKATTKLEFSVTSGMNMMQLMDIGLNHYVLTRRPFP